MPGRGGCAWKPRIWQCWLHCHQGWRTQMLKAPTHISKQRACVEGGRRGSGLESDPASWCAQPNGDHRLSLMQASKLPTDTKQVLFACSQRICLQCQCWQSCPPGDVGGHLLWLLLPEIVQEEQTSLPKTKVQSTLRPICSSWLAFVGELLLPPPQALHHSTTLK